MFTFNFLISRLETSLTVKAVLISFSKVEGNNLFWKNSSRYFFACINKLVKYFCTYFDWQTAKICFYPCEIQVDWLLFFFYWSKNFISIPNFPLYSTFVKVLKTRYFSLYSVLRNSEIIIDWDSQMSKLNSQSHA